MEKSKSLPVILIAGGSVLALVVLALILMTRSGGTPTAAEETGTAVITAPEPTPSPEQPQEQTQEQPQEQNQGGSARGGAVFGTSVRDPFMPLATPEASGGNQSSGSDKPRSSNPVPSTTKSTPKTADSKTDASGSGSGEAKTTKTDGKSTKDSGSKAPEPVGGSKPGGEPTEQVEVSVVQVQDSMAVVRINGSRTTLYVNVPDPSGVTYVSSLGDGCGWFATGDLTERYTICEGDSRPLS